jgi:hypothetical protein
LQARIGSSGLLLFAGIGPPGDDVLLRRETQDVEAVVLVGLGGEGDDGELAAGADLGELINVRHRQGGALAGVRSTAR